MPAPKNIDALAVFKECGAILEGHFILSSGRHSGHFLQKAEVFRHPGKTELLCSALADRIWSAVPAGATDIIVSPAVGAVVPGYETARQLDIEAVWAERNPASGRMELKRFDLEPGLKAVVVEDVVTTGRSAMEVMECLKEIDVEVLAVACIIDRSPFGDDPNFGDIPFVALAKFDAPTYAPDGVPPELAAIPAVKPGSSL